MKKNKNFINIIIIILVVIVLFFTTGCDPTGKECDHNWIDATCENPITCSKCKETKGKVLGHNFSTEWTIDKEPTYTEEGQKSKHCTRCDEVTEITTISKIIDVSNLIFELNEDGQSYKVTGLNNKEVTEIFIPSTYNNLPVTTIGYSAFIFCNGLTDVYYNGTIENWCDITFENKNSNPMSYAEHFYMLNEHNVYEEITNIKIPNTITKIGDYQFCGFNNITSITISDRVTSIGIESFYSCISLTNIEIPNSVTSIGYSAFYNCYSLTNITIPKDIKFIGSFAFYNCKSLINIEIPNSIQMFGSSVFEGCNNLNYNQYDNAYYLGNINNPFLILVKAINNSIDKCVINDKTNIILEYAFMECFNLRTIEIPDSIKKIEFAAFSGCINLVNIEIPNSVTGIGVGAFSGCINLISIKIPNSVTRIDYNAFEKCSSLTIYCEIESIPNEWDVNWNPDNRPVEWGVNLDSEECDHNWIDATCENPITCSKCKETKGEVLGHNFSTEWTIDKEPTDAEEGQKSKHCTRCDEVTEITTISKIIDVSNLIFELNEDGQSYKVTGLNNKEVTEIFIPSTYNNLPVTSIGDRAFFGCSSLKNIDIPASVTTIEYNAFYGCSSLTSIYIPNSVTTIGERAFAGCSSLKNIDIPASVTTIEYNAFYGCSSLTSIYIPNSVTTIGECAFTGCSSLTNIIVDVNNPVYDSRNNSNAIIETSINTLFIGCKNTIVPNTIIKINRLAFYECSSLKNIDIPASVTSIERDTFFDCSSLLNVTFEENSQLTNIGRNAFSGCSSLTSIEIPNSVTSIGSGAFSGCRSLTSIEIPTSVTSIGSGAFSGCRSLISIELLNSVTSIGYDAFYGCSSLTSIVVDEIIQYMIQEIIVMQ